MEVEIIKTYSIVFMKWLLDKAEDYKLVESDDTIFVINLLGDCPTPIYEVKEIYWKDIIHQAIDTINSSYFTDIEFRINDIGGSAIQIIGFGGVNKMLFPYCGYDSKYECRLEALKWIWEKTK